MILDRSGERDKIVEMRKDDGKIKRKEASRKENEKRGPFTVARV